MSLFALAALGFASRSFASVNMYLEITDAQGTITKVTVDKNGRFTSPQFAAGTYTLSIAYDHTVVIPIGGLGGTPQVSEITISYTAALTDTPHGQLSPRRQFEHNVTVQISPQERLLPTVNKKAGAIVIGANNEEITGSISLKDQNGNNLSVGEFLSR